MAAAKKSKRTRTTANRRHRATPERVSAELGARIRKLRRERGFSFDAFVGETDLGRGYVSELERGLAVPSLVTLCRVAEALEVSLVELLAGVGPNAERWSYIVGARGEWSAEQLAELRGVAERLRSDSGQGN